MRKIIEYKIVIPHMGRLEDVVNNLMEEGWQPFGSPYMSGTREYQAMVKYEETENV